MKVLLIGPGAVGVYFASRLAQAGAEVSVVTRSNIDAIRANGYAIKSYLGDYHFTPHAVYADAAEYPDVADWVIVATKVLPSVDLPRLLRGAIKSPHTDILMIQNGIDIEKEVEAAFPENTVYHAVAYIGTHRSAVGVINHDGAGNLTFGCNNGLCPPKARELEKLFAAVKVDAQLVDNIRFFRWKKLLWNTPYNSVSVLGGNLNTQEMSDGAQNEALCRAIMYEVAAVAHADGTELSEQLINENIEFTRNFPPYKTSMLVDFEAGRRMEVDAFVGNVLKIARAHGVATPRIEMTDTLLRALNRKF